VLGLCPALAAEAPPAARAAAARAAAEAFADWRLVCLDACRIETELRGASGEGEGAVVLRLALVPDDEAPRVSVETPLPLYLPDGAALRVGEGEPLALAWHTCDAAGCEARTAGSEALLAALRRERAATVEVTLLEGVRVRMEVSLMGFSAAERALAGQSGRRLRP
jgi:invasion protein IalB